MPNGKSMNFTRVRTIFFFGLIFLLGIVLLYLIRPFFYPIFWAAIIAIMFHPFYERINNYIKMPSVSSLVSVILVIVIIFLPLALLTTLLIQESLGLYHMFAQSHVTPDVQGLARWLEGTPLAPYVHDIQSEWTRYAANAARAVSTFLFQNLKDVTQNTVRFVFMLFMMFYTLYYFFKDGQRMLGRIMHLSPLGDTYEKMLYDKFRRTSVSTLRGTFIVGGVQGLLGGILFWITGVPGAFVWGVIMIALCIIPALGSFLIWLPAGIIMLLLGHIWQGVTILLVGAFVISLIDNLLRPLLVGKDIQMHPLMVLFATLGGIFLFGISGFIIGPIIASLFLAIMSIYDYYYQNELANN